MAYKQIRRRMKQEIAENDGAAPEVHHAPDLSQIQTDRDLMTADDAMALQDLVGNRAVTQLTGATKSTTPARAGYVQPKPLPAPMLRRESLPDRPAYAHIMRKLTSLSSQGGERTIQRAGGDGSFETNDSFESKVKQQSGGGQPLPSDVRADLEPKFGADFSGVKIHTGSTAAQLSQDVGAQAFTHGSDIYFNQGKYNPESGSGKQLLAHELTHTVQQGGSGVQREGIGISRTPTDKVQRLISKENFVRLAGDVSFKGAKNKGLYWQILQTLGNYQKLGINNIPGRKTQLMQLVTLTRKWLDKHADKNTYVDDGDFGEEYKANETKNLRKLMFMEGLKLEAEAELKGGDLPENSPSASIEDYDAASVKADQLSTDANAAKYQFSVLAAIDHPDYLDFAKARLALTVKERKKLFTRNKKSNSQIKTEAATSVVDAKYQDLSAEKKLVKINELKQIGGQVGHAWVKFTTFDTNDNQLGEDSFGFWPLKYFPHPEVQIPGMVRYPDKSHDKDAMIKRLDFEVTAPQYQAGMDRVTQLMKSPPNYKLIDYNCTKFTREVSQAVGVNFPENAFIRIPFKGLAWDPNSLYHELGQNPDAYNPTEGTVAEQAAQEQEQNRLREIELDLHGQYAQALNEGTVEKTITAEKITLQNVENFIERGELSRDGQMIRIVYNYENYLVKASEYNAFLNALPK